MKVKVQVVIESDGGSAEAVENIACLERGALQPENLGLTLAEAKAILAGVQKTMVDCQITDYLKQQTCCPIAGKGGSARATTSLCVERHLANYGCGACVSIPACVSPNRPEPSAPWPNCCLSAQHRSCSIWRQSLPL